jgi:ribose transport system substrate-binding protein
MNGPDRKGTSMQVTRSPWLHRPARLVALAAVAAVIGVAYVATAGSATTASKKIIYLGCDESNPFCASYNKTMETALQKAGFSVSSLYNNFDPSAQAQQMSQATAQKPDGIVVFVADSTAIVPSLARASAAGIPVMVVGTAVPASALKYVTLMNLQNSTQLGAFAAQNLVEGMKSEGLKSGNVIALTGTSSQIDVQQRMAAFKSYLAKYPQFKLVAVENANWDAVQSASDAKALFAKYASQGGIQGVYGMADYMAVGAINAAKGAGLKAGLPKGVIFTGSNCSTSGVQAIKAGTLYGDATQSPKVEAAAAASQIVAALNGKAPANKTTYNAEARFTMGNLAKYAAECTY